MIESCDRGESWWRGDAGSVGGDMCCGDRGDCGSVGVGGGSVGVGGGGVGVGGGGGGIANTPAELTDICATLFPMILLILLLSGSQFS